MEGRPEKFDKKPFTLPEEIRREIEQIREEDFWSAENLERQFEEDVAFGMKIWGGLVVIARDRFKKGSAEYIEIDERLDDLTYTDRTPNGDAQNLLALRRWLSESFKIPTQELSVRNILSQSYISEAQAMRQCGIDPEKNPPFSIGVRFNREHPMMQDALREEAKAQAREGGKLLERLMEETPSLKAKMEEFERALRPPPQESIE